MRVSVIIPCFKANKTITSTLDSVFKQTMDDYEIILIDAGNTLDLNLLLPYQEALEKEVLRIIPTEAPEGPAENRNHGASLARGEYIAYLDADDQWASDKLEKQLRAMKECTIHGKEPSICFSGRELMDEEGRDMKQYIGCEKIIRYKKLLRTNQINCSSVMLKRETALRHPFPSGNLHEDYVTWLSILSADESNFAVGINEPLLLYRVQKKSRSGQKFKSAIMNYRVYKYMQIPFAKRIYYMITYTLAGVKKHYGNSSRKDR